MDFLSTLPSMTLARTGNTTSYAADVFQGRPSFEEIQGFQGIMDRIALEVQASTQRTICPLASVDLIVDAQGLLGIFIFKSKLQSCNAKSAMLTLLKALPEVQQNSVQDTMRPFDYLDVLRVGEMQTVAGLRPYEEASSEEEEEPEVTITFCKNLSPTEVATSDPAPRGVTMEEFLAREVVKPPRPNLLDGITLAITNMETLQTSPAQATRVRYALIRWVEDAQETAAISILSIGTSQLCYQHCVHEARRELLIQKGLGKNSSFLDVVRRCLALVEVKQLPCPKTSAVIKGAFFGRCSKVLRTVNPEAECNRKALCPRESREVAILMGLTPKCDRCPSTTADHCFEWDKTLCRWTQYEINRPFGYTPCMTLKEDVMTLCGACTQRCRYACHLCRTTETLLESGDCSCGGRAQPVAPPGRPQTLLEKLNGFMVRLRGMNDHERSISGPQPEAEAAEVAYEQAAKRQRLE
jgi:hypothetical protein